MNLSIKDVPQATAQRLRERAARNHRSLQGELMAIVEQAAGADDVAPRVQPGGRVQGWMSIDQLDAERRARGWVSPLGAGVPLAVDIIRADRDSR
jgi:antitoxin FitA